MQTQQIFGVSGGGMLYSAKSAPVKSAGNSFDQLIQMSQNAGAANEQAAKPSEIKKDASAEVAKADKPAEVSSEKSENMTTAEEKPQLTKTEETKEPTDVEAAEKAAGVLNRVAEAVKEMLGLTDEELNQFLEELGLTNLDLLQPETLQNLVLMANSEQDAVILLTDDKLLSTVNDLTAQVDRILQEAGVSQEELANALNNPDFAGMVEEALSKGEAEVLEETSKSTDVENISVSDSNSSESIHREVRTEEKETGAGSNGQNEKGSTDVDQFTNQFLQNLQKAAGEIGELTGQKDMVQIIREVADQILEKVKVSVTAETTSLEIVLTPEELGKVNLTVSAEQDGMMKAHFVTENELAKEAIERNLVQFKEMLQEQGLKVDTIEVTVGNFDFNTNGQANESSQEQQKNSGRGFKTEDELGQKEDDQLARHFMEGGESTVNYMA